jgi:tetratricopeptide (TPR) repeat protein
MHQYIYDYFLKALSETDMERFEVHLIQCQRCQQELTRLDQAFQIMRLDQAYYREVVGPKVIPLKRLNLRRQLVRYAIAAIILITIGCSLFSYFMQPAYFGLARLTAETTLLTLKGESGQGEFETALQQFRQKDYVDAISGFKKFLVTQPRHYQTHYFLGLANLAAGETNILWYHRFSTTRTQEGIFYLQHAYELAGDNLFYQEACLWLLGKAWLRLGDREQARLTWQKLLELPSPDLVYREQVAEMLEKLN